MTSPDDDDDDDYIPSFSAPPPGFECEDEEECTLPWDLDDDEEDEAADEVVDDTEANGQKAVGLRGGAMHMSVTLDALAATTPPDDAPTLSSWYDAGLRPHPDFVVCTAA